MAVIAHFPFFDLACAGIDSYKLEFQREFQILDRKGGYPFIGLDFFHADGAIRIPVA